MRKIHADKNKSHAKHSSLPQLPGSQPAASVSAELLYGDMSSTLLKLQQGIRSAQDLKRRMAMNVLAQVSGNREEAAKILRLDRATLDQILDSNSA